MLPILALLFPTAVLAQVKINEFVAHPSTGIQEWVEFYNPSGNADFIKNYFVDDDTDFVSDSGNSPKRSLINLNTSSLIFPFINLAAATFNNAGDSVVLFDDLGNILDQFQFVSDPGVDVSWGRSPDQTGDFAIFAAGTTTKGAANVAASPTPAPTPTPTAEPTPTPEPTPIPTPTPTLTPTPTPTPEVSPSPSPSPSPSGFPHFTFSCHTDFLTFMMFGHQLKIPQVMCLARFI